MTAANVPIRAGGLLGTFTDRGVSEEASALRDRLKGIIDGFYESAYIRDVHRAARESLFDLASEASTDNWDGYGARAVSSQALENALLFIRSLPSTVPSPDVAAEPDGEVAFEWHLGPNRAFSVSVGEGDLLSFAGIRGRRKIHGTEVLLDEPSRVILQQLGQTLAD